MRKYGSEEEIGIKDAGSIDKQPWEGPCRKKYMRDENGWDMKMGLLISEWEELLRDPCYWPLRVVEVAPNKCEVQNPNALLSLVSLLHVRWLTSWQTTPSYSGKPKV